MTKTECQICASMAACLPCTSCGYTFCRVCSRKLVEGGERGECPSCRRRWTVDELQRRIGRTHARTVHRKARGVLLAKGVLAKDVTHLASQILSRKQRMANMEERRRLMCEIHAITQAQESSIDPERGPRSPEEFVMYATLQVERAAAVARSEYLALRPYESTDPAADVRRFRCGHSDCGGRFVTTLGACTTCHRCTCLECGVPVVNAERHVCSETARATTSLMREECRPCPGCDALSYRMEGCDDMWCVCCHTFWSWRTGNVIAGRARVPHNPDHQNYLRTRDGSPPARDPGDIPCGGVPSFLPLLRACNRKGGVRPIFVTVPFDPVDDEDSVIEAFRMNYYRKCRQSLYGPVDFRNTHYAMEFYFTVNSATSLLRFRYPARNEECVYSDDLMIDHVTGGTSLLDIQSGLERRERNADFLGAIHLIVHNFVLCGADLLQRLEQDDDFATGAFVQEADGLRRVFNDATSEVARTFDRSVPEIADGFFLRVPGTRLNDRPHPTFRLEYTAMYDGPAVR